MVRFTVVGLLGGLLVCSLLHVVRADRDSPLMAPETAPSSSWPDGGLVGAGVVEPCSENISLGTPSSGLVAEVLVRAGNNIKSGTPLFRLDDRTLRADQALQRAALEVARTELVRREKWPPPEELLPGRARVAEARARLNEQVDLLGRVRRMVRQNAATSEELVRSSEGTATARARLARVEAEQAVLERGTWKADLDIARAQLAQAEARLGQVQTELERLVVRAPVAGQVLRVNVRPGEHVDARQVEPFLILGDITRLHVRVEFNEQDASLFSDHAHAWAVPRGRRATRRSLQFVRLEPLVVPKRSMTGDSAEKVDTRVLVAIYALPSSAVGLHVGQQVDVFLEAVR